MSTFADRGGVARSTSSDLLDDEGHPDLRPEAADLNSSVTPIGGAWAALSHEVHPHSAEDLGAFHGLPTGFKGLATPGMNPMVMTLTHEEVVVGCTDGTI